MAATQERGAKAGRWGGRISLSGLLLLCVSFFLPQDRFGVPAAETVSSWDFLVLWGLPFLFGFIGLPFRLLRWVFESDKRRAAAVATILSFSCVVLLCAGSILMWTWAAKAHLTDSWVLASLIVTVLMVSSVAALARCRASRRFPLAFFHCGTACLAYFLYVGLVDPEDTYYGLWVSVLASLLISAGSFVEAIRAHSKDTGRSYRYVRRW
jgi:hypothetical protein